MSDDATRKAALTIAVMTSFTTPFMLSSINIALPAIAADLGLDAVLLSWVATAYLLAAAVAMVPAGRLADIHGRKRVYATGLAVFMVFTLASGLATSAPMLIAFRALQGLGGGMIFATGTAILVSVFPRETRGRVLGITIASVYVGLSLGPLLGGLLTEYLSWRSLFLAVVPLCVVILVLIAWKLKGEWAEARGERFDAAGAAIYGAALIALMTGVAQLPAAKSALPMALGVAGLAAFVAWERRVEHPVVEMGLFLENRVFAFSSLAALLNYAATFAAAFLLSLYLQQMKGLSPRDAGLVLVAQPVMMALVSPFAGRLSDRVEPRVVASAGMAISAAALVGLLFLGDDTALGWVMANLMVFGAGLGLFTSPNTNAIMSAVDKRFYGLAAGTAATMRMLGQMTSMGIATVIFAVVIGRTTISAEVHVQFMTSMKIGFAVFAVLCVAGVFASLARGRVR